MRTIRLFDGTTTALLAACLNSGRKMISMLPRKQNHVKPFCTIGAHSRWLKSVLEQRVFGNEEQWGIKDTYIYWEQGTWNITSGNNWNVKHALKRYLVRQHVVFPLRLVLVYPAHGVCTNYTWDWVGQVVGGVLMNMSSILVCPGVAGRCPFFDKQFVYILYGTSYWLLFTGIFPCPLSPRIRRTSNGKSKSSKSILPSPFTRDRHDATHFSRVSKNRRFRIKPYRDDGWCVLVGLTKDHVYCRVF